MLPTLWPFDKSITFRRRRRINLPVILSFQYRWRFKNIGRAMRNLAGALLIDPKPQAVYTCAPVVLMLPPGY